MLVGCLAWQKCDQGEMCFAPRRAPTPTLSNLGLGRGLFADHLHKRQRKTRGVPCTSSGRIRHDVSFGDGKCRGLGRHTRQNITSLLPWKEQRAVCTKIGENLTDFKRERDPLTIEYTLISHSDHQQSTNRVTPFSLRVL